MNCGSRKKLMNGENFCFELWRPVRDLFLVKQNLFVNIIIRLRYFQNLDVRLTNMWLVFLFLIESWLNLKYSFGEATLFLKCFHFCINFINFLANICADQVVLKLRVLNQEKKFLISTTVKFPSRNLNHDIQNFSNWQ